MADPNTAADLDIREPKQGLFKRLSLVWFVPIIALLISLGVAYDSFQNRGTLIEIAFENASGITPGETKVKYRDVNVGEVEDIEFSPGLDVVIAKVRMDKDIVPYLDDDAQFWVVEPDVSVRGISGLDTVLSGVYIQATWDTEPDVTQYSFEGLEKPPLVTADQRGTAIVLRARDGGALAKGAPILHKGIQVGYLEEPELQPDGESVTVGAFIEAPFDRRITSSTRFWDASGFSVSLGTGGVSLNVDSLASLIQGGIAYDTVVSGGSPVQDGHVFDLFPSEDTARDSLFGSPNVETLEVAVLFDGTVSGLSKGSAVQFQGLRVGEVSELSAVVVDDRNETRVQLRTVLSIEPSRLGMGEAATPDDALMFLTDFVRQGLRARLATGNILSGSLVVQLIEVEDAPLAVLNTSAEPYPLIPTTTNAITDVADSAEGVLQRITDLPIEELLGGAIDLMDSIERLVNQDGLQEVPETATLLLEDLRALVGSEDVQTIAPAVRDAIAQIDQVIADAGGVVEGVDGSVASLNSFITELTESDLPGQLQQTLDTANEAAANIAAGTEGLPAITAEVETLIQQLTDLQLQAVVDQADGALGAIDDLLSQQGTQDLPAQVGASLDELRALVAEVREGGAVQNVNAALQSASEAARAIEEAVEGLPELSARANRLVAETESVISGYSERSRFNQDLQTTLRDIQEAADAVSDLARAIQRNPNSLLTGR